MLLALLALAGFIAMTSAAATATCQCSGCPGSGSGGVTCSSFLTDCEALNAPGAAVITSSATTCSANYAASMACQAHLTISCSQTSPTFDYQGDCNDWCQGANTHVGSGLSCASGTWSCSDSSSCFPANATVQLVSGASKTMAELEVGDRVLVDANTYSDVYMFSHRYADFSGPFVAITTASGEELMLTADHYLYVNGKLAVASTVQVGDRVVKADGTDAAVVAVSTQHADGLYNPHTLNGDIVVNGIKTSTYTAAVEPSLAHSLLWPVRMLYSLGVNVLESVFDQGSDAVVSLLPRGEKRYN